uniref:Uncharacterized protein n=1 Tax=Rhizophora mucronata TaxID=61149 RepID=A0A2P2NU36_RHIMU
MMYAALPLFFHKEAVCTTQTYDL